MCKTAKPDLNHTERELNYICRGLIGSGSKFGVGSLGLPTREAPTAVATDSPGERHPPRHGGSLWESWDKGRNHHFPVPQKPLWRPARKFLVIFFSVRLLFLLEKFFRLVAQWTPHLEFVPGLLRMEFGGRSVIRPPEPTLVRHRILNDQRSGSPPIMPSLAWKLVARFDRSSRLPISGLRDSEESPNTPKRTQHSG